jgi:phosphoadenosine phosphosulfate reductase
MSEPNLRATDLRRRYDRSAAIDLLDAMIHDEFSGRIALSSSFGADSAVLLHMVSRIDTATPVLFLETGKLFGETLRYRIDLARRLGLSDVRDLRPAPQNLQAHDADGVLWRDAPDACCHIRKVVPLNEALEGFDAWINGRKRVQGGLRADIELIEDFGGRIKINPLAQWDLGDIAAYFDRYDLPRQPLVAGGYGSIGCVPCTARTGEGANVRDGRWAGADKTECGIHLPTAR